MADFGISPVFCLLGQSDLSFKFSAEKVSLKTSAHLGLTGGWVGDWLGVGHDGVARLELHLLLFAVLVAVQEVLQGGRPPECPQAPSRRASQGH